MRSIWNCAKLDIRIMKPYCKSVIYFIAMGLVMSILLNSGEMLLSMSMVMLFLVASYPFAIVEKNKMDVLYGTLTVDKKSVVFGRYMSSAIFGLIGISVAFVGYIIVQLLFGHELDFAVIMLMICAVISVYLLIVSIQFPTLFKYGFTKGKIVSYIPFFVLCGLLAALPLATTFLGLDINLEGVLAGMFNYSALLCIGLVLIGIIVFSISCHISRKIFEKKDI